MLTATLSETVQNKKQPKCPLTGEQANKLWYIQIVKLLLHNTEQSIEICNNMDEPQNNYVSEKNDKLP